MDYLSIVGVIIALVAILGGNALEGGEIGALANGPALVIVFGGTVGAIMLQTPMSVFLHALRSAGSVFKSKRRVLQPTIKKIIDWSNIARKEGLLGLETIAENEPDLFIRKGMQLLVDGSDSSYASSGSWCQLTSE